MRAPLIRLVLAVAAVAALGSLGPASGPLPPARAQEPQQQQSQPPPNPPQPPAGQNPQRPTFRAGINFVSDDVIVSDNNGNPILDLKPEEFSVSEDGKAQKIEQFSIVKIDPLDQVEGPTNSAIRSEADEQREASRPEVRLFTILLDDYHVRRGNDMAVRKPLIDFIQNQLAPADMVAIMYPMTPVNDISFTRNRAALISAIEKFEGRKFNYTARNSFEEQYAFYPASTVERIRNQITLGALEAAALRMGALREGRKSIIFVSEGLTESLPPQLNDPVAALPGIGNPNRNNAQAVTNEREDWERKTDLLSELRRVFQTVNTQNTSIYSVDPRGLAVFEYGINEGVGLQQDSQGLKTSLDTLYTLSNNTDGRAIVNRNDLAVGMKQIIRDASGYYLLGYTSSAAPTDGRFHEIKVRVTRRGVQVRARRGYWALTNEDVARVMAPPKPPPPAAVTKALTTLAEPPGGRPARFWIGTSRGETGRSRVTFVWEPGMIEGARAQGAPAARVQLTAVAADGRPMFRGRIPEAAAPAATATVASGGIANFEVPPGQLQLRMTVESEDGQVLDSSTRELTVPDYTTVQVSLGTPRVYRGRTARDIQSLRSGVTAAPAVERVFSRQERLLIRVESYGPGGSTPAVTGKLLNRAGAMMSELPLQPGANGLFETEVPLSALAAGEYLIELTAKSESGTAQDTIAFRVGR
ncbi:MAG TPA: VWA domain-containing protein [Vicinamibacterales bacterium]|nr:VWA domain-containing protein [Vicinamibacterales bacterium]